MSNPQIYTVGWVCSIPAELVAAQSFLDHVHPEPLLEDKSDNNGYVLGSIGSHNVVIAVLPLGEYGTASAATVARDMVRSFPNIRFGLLVGIGGGVPSAKDDIRLGDVVVSSSGKGKGGVCRFDARETMQDQPFRENSFLDQPPMLLRTAVSKLIARHDLDGQYLQDSIEAALKKISNRDKYARPPQDTDRLYRPSFAHSSPMKCCSAEGEDADVSNLVIRGERDEEGGPLIIHYGLIGSGDGLINDAVLRDELAAQSGAICFETEAAGLMNHFPCLVIRGVCDYADSHANEQWQGFAAMAAAAYAKDLLGCIAPRSVDNMKRIFVVLQSS